MTAKNARAFEVMKSLQGFQDEMFLSRRKLIAESPFVLISVFLLHYIISHA